MDAEQHGETPLLAALRRSLHKRTGLVLGLALAFVLVLYWTHEPNEGLVLHDPPHAHPPALLRHMFICVSFAWRPLKIVYLKQIAIRSGTYPTQVDMCVVSDQPAKVQALIGTWDMPHVRVCGTHNQLNASEKYALLYEHRDTLAEAHRTGKYSMFMYLEDDTDVPWPALLSWAADTEVLEPLGFLRHFWRTEISTFTGSPVFLDFLRPMNLSEWNRTLHLEDAQLPPPGACRVQNPEEPYWSWREGPPGCHHRHYIQLASPYYGMYTATPRQLERFMASPYWSKAGALSAKIERADYQNLKPMYGNWPWGYPERSTAMIQFVDRPDGFWSRGVVPYDPQLRQLPPIGRVGHERNGYRTSNRKQLDVRGVFQPDGTDVSRL